MNQDGWAFPSCSLLQAASRNLHGAVVSAGTTPLAVLLCERLSAIAPQVEFMAASTGTDDTAAREL